MARMVLADQEDLEGQVVPEVHPTGGLADSADPGGLTAVERAVEAPAEDVAGEDAGVLAAARRTARGAHRW